MLLERILSIYDNIPIAIIENAFSMMKLTNIATFYPSKTNIPCKYISTVIS